MGKTCPAGRSSKASGWRSWGDRFYEWTRIDEGRSGRWFCSEQEAGGKPGTIASIGAADQPFTAPPVRPAMSCRCRMTKTSMAGAPAISELAMISPQPMPETSLRSKARPTGSVRTA